MEVCVVLQYDERRQRKTASAQTKISLRIAHFATALLVFLGAGARAGDEFIPSDKYPEFRFKADVPMKKSIEFDPKNPWIWAENDRVKVGMHLEFGGSICWISEAKSKFNLVNWHDPGRQIQASYYVNDGFPELVNGGAGPKDGGGMRIWCWNPVQAGDARDHRSPVLDLRSE